MFGPSLSSLLHSSRILFLQFKFLLPFVLVIVHISDPYVSVSTAVALYNFICISFPVLHIVLHI
jgi:hypothetical protein